MVASRAGVMVGVRIALAMAVVTLAFGPLFLSRNQMSLVTEFNTILVLALMWGFLAGYADIITVGQHAFVGIGAYAFYGFAALAGVPAAAAMALAGGVATLCAIPIMAVVFRLRVAYLAVGTWVVAEVVTLMAGKIQAFGGGAGSSLPLAVLREVGATAAGRAATIYWLALGLVAAAFATTYLLLRSRTGLGLIAMRDNEEGAGAVGVNLVRSRVLCFLWTSPFLGLAGVLITLQKLRIGPGVSFSLLDWTIYIIFIVVIGGIGSLEGPVIGAAVFFVVRQVLSDQGAWYLIALGVLAIGVVMIEPRGLWGLLRRLTRADIISMARRTRVVS